MRYPTAIATALVLILSSVGTGFAQTQPQTTTRPPSASQSSPPYTSAAQPPQGATTYASENVARANCGSQLVVWMNTDSNIYHYAGSKDYGRTKAGAFLCKDVADKIGRAAKNEKEPPPPKPTTR